MFFPCLTPKFRAFILLLLAAWAISARAASFPEDGEERLSLNGTWQFTIDPTVPDQPEAKWDTITVPGNWDTLPAYSTYKGKGCYRRTFTVPADWKGRSIRLQFGAVYHDAEVSLNGKPLGGHAGGYTPFEFDVTGNLVYGGTNTVTVWADNTYERGAWWHWGGISRDVNLVANNGVRIVWQHLRAEPDLKKGDARIFVQYKLANSGARPVSVKVSSEIAEKGETGKPRSAGDAILPAHATKTIRAEFVLPKEAVKLWDFDHPNLYVMRSSVCGADGKLLHRISDRFGIRKVVITADGLYLNGERVRLPGFNRVSDSNETGNTEPDSLVHQDVDMMKRCGAAMARLMHVAQAPNLLDYLDEKGMLIFEEIPVWGKEAPEMIPDSPLGKQWLTETVDRDYNHPCIIGWSPGNELRGTHYAYVKSMLDFIRKDLDPHRLAAYVSFTGARNEYGPKNDPITCNDVVLYNTYGKPHDQFVRNPRILRERWPNKPIFFSEFGASQIGASPEATIPHLEEIWAEMAKDHPYVIGGALWTFNDYRSNFRGTPPSGNREWGVVDVQRHPKAAYEQVRKIFCPARSLRVVDGMANVEPHTPDEIPSYTLRGYKLRWVMENGVAPADFALPDLKPGDPVFKTPLPKGTVRAVQLITPTGYDVAECAAR